MKDKITVSELFVEIYQNFNVSNQRPKMNLLEFKWCFLPKPFTKEEVRNIKLNNNFDK